jgi:ferrous iron transport protein B
VKAAQKEIRVGLIGNPNCGKTTIFNALTGSHQKVANWSGVTIEKREGMCRYRDFRMRIVDLPGIYSLSAYSLEEIVARNYIIHDQPDVIVNIVDAGNLERNLYLTTQLINIGVKVILVLNMYDEARNKGISVDTDRMGTLLGMPVIKTVGARNEGIPALLNTIVSVAEARDDKVRHIHIDYGIDIENEVREIQEMIWKERNIRDRYSTRWLALRLLENDSDVRGKLAEFSNFEEITAQTGKSREIIEKKFKDDAAVVMTERRQGFIVGLLKESVTRGEPLAPDLSERIDRVLMNRYLGYPILLAFMWVLFQSTYVLGEYPKNLIEWAVEALSSGVTAAVPEGALRNLLTRGILSGVGGVVVFLPNILILFLGVSLMEDSGYMARAAFIMDKFMHRLGIHGKSFIPLVMGFGCNVPAIMASRTLENRRDRIITVLINPFMSCSARLPVYVLFAGVFFAHHAGIVILSLYLIGVLLAFLSSRLFKLLFFKGESAPFVMELPPYRLPTLRSILLHMWNRSSQYLRKMGGLILIFSVIIWVLGEYPASREAEAGHRARVAAMESVPLPDGAPAELTAAKEARDRQAADLEREYRKDRLRHTVIGQFGNALAPVFETLGFNWQMGVSLVTGVVAKEIVLSTMGVLYAADSPGEGSGGGTPLEDALRHPEHRVSPLAAYVYMLFVLLYIPCIATIVTIGREIGWRWAVFSVFYNITLTWFVCFTCYRAGLALGLG